MLRPFDLLAFFGVTSRRRKVMARLAGRARIGDDPQHVVGTTIGDFAAAATACASRRTKAR
jgi:hypothetical protein